MERYKPILLLCIAVLVALVTSVITYKWLQKKGDVKVIKEVKSFETQPVTVAMDDLSWGTVLRKEMIKIKPFLKGSLNDGDFFSDPSSLEGRVVIYPIKANEPILISRLAPDSVTTGGVAAIITPKKRAMAIKVDKVIGVSGFIYPGQRVDVLVTVEKKEGNSNNPETKMVLQNILVLAAGSEIEKKDKQEEPTKVDVITLEVTSEEAEKLGLSASEGKIQLALRNYTDTEDVLTKGTTVSSLLASYRPVEKKGSQKVWTYREEVVEVIKGSTVSKIKF
jgi:pilus assembly protein CpaB